MSNIVKTKTANETTEKYFRPIKELVRMVVKGYANAVVLLSEGGLGKSYTVLKTLKEEGLEEGRDFQYIQTFSTPLELYNMLYVFRNQIIVLDDVEGLLEERKAVSILKSALWSSDGKRHVSYYSTSERLHAPKRFLFPGRVILCLNDIEDSKIIRALTSRCLVYKFDFSYQQKIEIMEAIAGEQNIPSEVIEFIKLNTSPATKNLNFRSLIHLWDAYRYDMNNGNTGGWKTLGKSLLNADENLSLVWELARTKKPVKQQIENFKTTTGKSRASYFRYKNKLVSKSHW
jgi:hypothetical protein